MNGKELSDRKREIDRERARELVPFNMGKLFPHFFGGRECEWETLGLLCFHFILMICMRYGFHAIIFARQVNCAKYPPKRRHSFTHSFIFCVCQSVSQWVSLPVDKCILHTIPLTLCQISTTHTHAHTSTYTHAWKCFCFAHIRFAEVVVCFSLSLNFDVSFPHGASVSLIPV